MILRKLFRVLIVMAGVGSIWSGLESIYLELGSSHKPLELNPLALHPIPPQNRFLRLSEYDLLTQFARKLNTSTGRGSGWYIPLAAKFSRNTNLLLFIPDTTHEELPEWILKKPPLDVFRLPSSHLPLKVSDGFGLTPNIKKSDIILLELNRRPLGFINSFGYIAMGCIYITLGVLNYSAIFKKPTFLR